MRHYLRNRNNEFWSPNTGWAARTDETCHFGSDVYISLDDLVKFYFSEYSDEIKMYPLLGTDGMHVYVELEEIKCQEYDSF